MHQAIVIALALFASLALAQQQDFNKVEIKVTKVSGNIYMLEGSGGNIGVSAGEDGIVIVDNQYAPLAAKIREALKGIVDKPVRFVINTHYHGDHTGGNVNFGETSTILAHDNVRKRLLTGTPKAGLPVITFDHDVSVHVNGEDIRALHFPSGHTDGDVIVFFPKSNVVHMGDDFVRYGFPYIDIKSGGSVQGMIDGLEKTIGQLPPDVKVIPGHGAVSNLDDVREFVKMLKATSAIIQNGITAGKSLETLKSENVMAAWQKWSGSFIKTDTWIETLYSCLTNRQPAGFVRHN
ncbi:MAG: MBL fold metallo-hydrolase [Bryobacterales bacterium]|nr:MBL fold metallo-hydrolase [Bryobacterales bacterium]